MLQRTKDEYQVKGYIESHLVARAAGVSLSAFANWVKNNAGPVARKIKGRRHVPMWVADRYFDNNGIKRLTRRPRNWVTVKGLALDLGLDRQTVRRWAAKHNLRIGWYQASLLMPAEDAAILTGIVREMRPLAGWVSLVDASEELGVSKRRLRRAVEALNLEMRSFKEPNWKERFYIHRQDMGRVAERISSMPVRNRLTDWEVTRIRRLAFTGLSSKEISEITGAPTGSIDPLITGHNRKDAGGPIRGVHYKRKEGKK